MNARAKGNWQGMNWIRQEKRLAIYLRDGLACCWCGASVDGEATQLTLDHLVPHIKGGSNDATNLVTSCHKCNTSRGTRSIPKFAQVVAAYINHGLTAKAVEDHVRKCARRSLVPHLSAAKALIAERGSASAVLLSQKG